MTSIPGEKVSLPVRVAVPGPAGGHTPPPVELKLTVPEFEAVTDGFAYGSGPMVLAPTVIEQPLDGTVTTAPPAGMISEPWGDAPSLSTFSFQVPLAATVAGCPLSVQLDRLTLLMLMSIPPVDGLTLPGAAGVVPVPDTFVQRMVYPGVVVMIRRSLLVAVTGVLAGVIVVDAYDSPAAVNVAAAATARTALPRLRIFVAIRFSFM
ncbi:hypothetical protein GS462_16930 [Rhodococcus hoagii]|uniref:Uncharacterized protein n=1 Tax=Rhodococcus hoagii TaxID=43767 RepID=A0AAE5IMC1_RHOHA|nr:hypothetical protein C7H75_20180 [Prescottella equi]MBM4526310.1 hypothetical protein [Prescottella equi]MBM4652082.1 hypothetical protein [Prescottella equi]MBM4684166.1 hypothetical protein [Prescottella equi]NKS82930.1 hypothetical protein [Prescottella equi]